MKLLIHHHAPAFVDEQGIHVQSFIGCWVKAMSAHVEEIGLLLPAVPVQSAVQDTLIVESNIKLYPLPLGGKRWDYFQRRKQIRAVCQAVSTHYDALLVRGLTPRQWTIWVNCRVPQKAFLLVGSLLENRPEFSWSLSGFLTWALSYVRRLEFGRISTTGILLANSPHLVEEIAAFSGKSAVFVSTNTLQKRHLRPLVLRETGHPCRLLFCGRVVADKGIEELVEALGLLHQKDPGHFRLTIVGNVAVDYKHTLGRLAKQYDVSELIEWLGFVPFGERLLEIYRESDFMVLPSYHEGFPHSIWEAAICSVPVITTRAGGIPGLMDDSMVQFIEKRSAEDIVEKLYFLLKDKEMRWNKVAALHQFAQKFTVEQGVADLIEIIRK